MRRALTIFVLYGGGNALRTSGTSALLMRKRLLVDLINVKSLLCASMSNPSAVYPTNDVAFSGAYGGSR